MKYTTKGRGRVKPVLAALMAVGLFASACGGGDGGDQGGNAGGSGDAKSDPIEIGYINWNEDVALTYLWRHLLTEQGYEVKMRQLDASAIFQGMATGELDLMFDTWLPATHENYWNQYGDKLSKLTKWYETAPLELAVPAYTYNKGVQSIGDLDDNAALFDGKLTGIGPSAGETRLINENVMPAYNLKGKMQHVVTSSTTMLSQLKEATQNKEDIVVALWRPHWAWEAYDIKPLKDPKNAWGKADSIYVSAAGQEAEGSGSFKGDYPKAASWISKMKLTPEQIASLSNAVVNNAEGEQARLQAAKKWANENQDLISQWVPQSSGS